MDRPMQLTIEKLIYGGDGLARLPADADPGQERGKAVFVPFVLEGESVEATITEEKPGFARARLSRDRVLTPSPHRTEPPCPYYGQCGGCHYQHTTYEHQLRIKQDIARENFRRLARLDWRGPISVLTSPPWNYRNRTRLRVRATPEFALCYARHRARELLPVESCPISSPLINRAISVVTELGRGGKFPAGIAEVEFFARAAGERLLVELHAARHLHARAGEKLCSAFLEQLTPALPEAVGVALLSAVNERHQAEPRLLASAGARELEYKVDQRTYRVSAGSFFQANRHLLPNLPALVTGAAAGDLAWDLYAGVGLFSLPLAEKFARVVAVEAGDASFQDLRRNAPANVKAVRSSTDAFLERSPKRPQPQLIVVDPPRGGLGPRVTRSLAAIVAPRLHYLSCDPATLSRDLKALLESGYRVERVHLIDLFPQTFHVELLVELAR
ncbi:MAG TPA: 23S rRNA (uracil(1939)-C(5))-methyltransferase RlmD [Terriglobales bacterium]|nr:23S rRNA (uracil(1939)-C(5))-methyltransferase RlmD [Terriglobales bacterium]